MTADDSLGRLDDDDYPAHTMGRAAEMIGTTPPSSALWATPASSHLCAPRAASVAWGQARVTHSG